MGESDGVHTDHPHTVAAANPARGLWVVTEPKLKLPSLDPLFGGRADRRWNSNFVRSQLRLEEIDIAAVLTLQMDPKTSTICGAIGRGRALWHRRLDFNHARHDVSL